MVAWLDRGPHITAARKRRLHSDWWSRWKNPPVARLCETRLKQMTPDDKMCEPYVVATLIAMAQAQRKWEDRDQERRRERELEMKTGSWIGVEVSKMENGDEDMAEHGDDKGVYKLVDEDMFELKPGDNKDVSNLVNVDKLDQQVRSMPTLKGMNQSASPQPPETQAGQSYTPDVRVFTVSERVGFYSLSGFRR